MNSSAPSMMVYDKPVPQGATFLSAGRTHSAMPPKAHSRFRLHPPSGPLLHGQRIRFALCEKSKACSAGEDSAVFSISRRPAA